MTREELEVYMETRRCSACGGNPFKQTCNCLMRTCGECGEKSDAVLTEIDVPIFANGVLLGGDSDWMCGDCVEHCKVHFHRYTIYSYFDNDLPEEDKVKVGEHLQNCEECAERFTSLLAHYCRELTLQ